MLEEDFWRFLTEAEYINNETGKSNSQNILMITEVAVQC